MFFEHRDMLVCRSVEHDFRQVVLERLEHSLAVVDVDQGLVRRASQRGCGVVEVGLIVVEQDQPGRPHAGHLTADF